MVVLPLQEGPYDADELSFPNGQVDVLEDHTPLEFDIYLPEANELRSASAYALVHRVDVGSGLH